MLERTGALPDCVIACVGGGSNAIGMFHAVPRRSVASRSSASKPVAAGAGLGDNAATLATGTPGRAARHLHDAAAGSRTARSRRRTRCPRAWTIRASGRSTRCCATSGASSYIMALDDDALDCVQECSTHEGILPAIESAHALVGARDWARRNPGKRVLVGLSGRGDKDMPTLQKTLLARAGDRAMSATIPTPAQQLERAIRAARTERVALVAFLTAGFPSQDRLPRGSGSRRRRGRRGRDRRAVHRSAGRWRDHPALQPRGARAGRHRCSWILESSRPCRSPKAQLVLMGYLNPMLAFGLPALAARAAQVGCLRLHRAGPAGGGERGVRAGAGAARPGADPHGHAGHAAGPARAAVRAARRVSSMR